MVIPISSYTTRENVAKAFGNINFCTDTTVHFKVGCVLSFNNRESEVLGFFHK